MGHAQLVLKNVTLASLDKDDFITTLAMTPGPADVPAQLLQVSDLWLY